MVSSGTEYDSISYMFDGGGPGQSGATYDNDNDPNNEVTGIAKFSNIFTGNSHANDGYGDDNSSGQSPNYQTTSTNNDAGSATDTKVKGAAPTSIGINFTTGVIGKLAGPITQVEPTTEKKVEEDEAHFNIQSIEV